MDALRVIRKRIKHDCQVCGQSSLGEQCYPFFFFFFLKIERLEGFPFILLLLIFNQLCCFGSVAFEKPVRYLSGNFN